MTAVRDMLSFDIYRVADGFTPQLVERVDGLAVAKGRMAKLAAQTPGQL